MPPAGALIDMHRQRLRGDAPALDDLASVGDANPSVAAQFGGGNVHALSLHSANRNASENVCGVYNDSHVGKVQHAPMANEDRNYLRQWREFRRMSQDELAAAADTTKSVISLLENEKRPLSSKWLRRFAEILETRPGHILDVDPNAVDSDLIDIWLNISAENREQAIRVLQTFARTGTSG